MRGLSVGDQHRRVLVTGDEPGWVYWVGRLGNW